MTPEETLEHITTGEICVYKCRNCGEEGWLGQKRESYRCALCGDEMIYAHTQAPLDPDKPTIGVFQEDCEDK